MMETIKSTIHLTHEHKMFYNNNNKQQKIIAIYNRVLYIYKEKIINQKQTKKKTKKIIDNIKHNYEVFFDSFGFENRTLQNEKAMMFSTNTLGLASPQTRSKE